MHTLSEAIAAIKAGRRDDAREILRRILTDDPLNINAMLWATEVAQTDDERRKYLTDILRIDPANAMAIKGLEILGKENEQPPWIANAKPTADRAENVATRSDTDVETVYYSDDNVSITNTRAVFSGKTYALANVTSVEMAIKPPEGQGYASVFLLGGGAAIMYGLSGIGSMPVQNILVLIFIGGCVALLSIGTLRAKPSYIVKVSSSSGEANALISPNKQYIQEVVKAVNDAIVKRG